MFSVKIANSDRPRLPLAMRRVCARTKRQITLVDQTFVTMPIKTTGIMTDLLRQALAEDASIYAVAQATNHHRASLLRFQTGEHSLRLDLTDKLAAYSAIDGVTNPKESK
jgi:hypothetical protein